MKRLWEIGNFVRALRAHMKYGELSRAPLQILRVEIRGEMAECDWMARPPDPWDSALPRRRREQMSSDQALRDAIGMSQLLFDVLPGVSEAHFRAFRKWAREPPQPIIVGQLNREASPPTRVASLVMRAKLHGFRFRLDEGILVPLDVGEESTQLQEVIGG